MIHQTKKFLSTLSLRRATVKFSVSGSVISISIHALLAESDNASYNCRSARPISIHALLAESDVKFSVSGSVTSISIHALLAESDPDIRRPARRSWAISIHALLAESDCVCPSTQILDIVISIHALLAESDGIGAAAGALTGISIHALLAESDRMYSVASLSSSVFLSTLSLRRATPLTYRAKTISTNFYPRSPCGERPQQLIDTSKDIIKISIHALLAESDLIRHMAHLTELLFLSTLSLRRATNSLLTSVVSSTDFYPRSPCGERPKQSIHHKSHQ